jgi:hypothetical protein
MQSFADVRSHENLGAATIDTDVAKFFRMLSAYLITAWDRAATVDDTMIPGFIWGLNG